MSYPAGEVTLRDGLKVPVEVTHDGFWQAGLGDQLHSAGSKEELRDRLMRATARAKVRVAVQFSELDRPKWSTSGRETVVKHGIATGIHAGNSNVIAQYEGRRGSEQISGRGTRLRALSAEEAAEWVRLDAAANAARKALDDFEKPRQIFLASVVRDAVEAAADQALAAGRASEEGDNASVPGKL